MLCPCGPLLIKADLPKAESVGEINVHKRSAKEALQRPGSLSIRRDPGS